MSEGYVRAIERFASRNQISVVRFQRRESKEEVARPYFEQAEREGRFGVVMIGVAQERARVWAGWRQGGSDAHPHFAFGWQSRVPNHYYFYVRDREWGRAFVKACCYAPYPLWLCLNGHEWAKRRAEQAGIGYQPLDNGFRSCSDGEALAAICARLSARDVWSFFRRWQRILPSPLSAQDGERGYRYQLALRQIELSDTRVFDRPEAGRAWFERVIRDQLALGRPDQVSLVFARRVIATTPGRFQTKVLNRGVEPAIQVLYKHSKVKQYFKDGRALRTETTVNDTYDFGVGRLLTDCNRQALLEIGHQVNERLRTRRHDARARRPALPHRRRPARPRASLRRPARASAARGALRLPAPARRRQQPQPATAGRPRCC